MYQFYHGSDYEFERLRKQTFDRTKMHKEWCKTWYRDCHIINNPRGQSNLKLNFTTFQAFTNLCSKFFLHILSVFTYCQLGNIFFQLRCSYLDFRYIYLFISLRNSSKEISVTLSLENSAGQNYLETSRIFFFIFFRDSCVDNRKYFLFLRSIKKTATVSQIGQRLSHLCKK